MAMPEAFIACFKGWVADRRGRYGIALFRFVFGIALFLAAPESKQPLAFQIFGALACIKALMILLMPIDTVISYTEKFMNKPQHLRAWILVGIGVCIYIVYLTPVIAPLT
jgi:uncharacterized membrane protein YidH (DUF202 family)